MSQRWVSGPPEAQGLGETPSPPVLPTCTPPILNPLAEILAEPGWQQEKTQSYTHCLKVGLQGGHRQTVIPLQERWTHMVKVLHRDGEIPNSPAPQISDKHHTRGERAGDAWSLQSQEPRTAQLS